MYASARSSRLTGGWGAQSGSADTELSSSLPQLRDRSRALVRDAAYAKRASQIVKNNVVGTGIGMQAQVMTTRGELSARINDAIEREWREWCRATNCHTGGAFHFSDFERSCMGQIFEAGEVFIRKHYRKFGESRVPLALEMIEGERIADDQFRSAVVSEGREVRMGVEVDQFGRAIAYWIRERHPGEIGAHSATRFVRVPAEEIIHLRVVDRWPQTRGEPWMHASARKLNDMDGYTEAEIIAARGAASYMGFIKTDDPASPIGEVQDDGSEEYELSPGTIPKLAPGESFEGYAPNRPNSALDPFLRYMLREYAAGVSVSYESVSRDYSQSNYSSSRLALLDDRDLWRVLQQWFIRAFRETLHREWLQQAILAGAIPEIGIQAYGANRATYEAVLFKPRGWSWVDPTKEVDAYEKAVRCGFTTVSRVIAATADGLDLEDIIAERQRELKLMREAGLEVDTDPQAAPAKGAEPKVEPAKDSDGDKPKPEVGSDDDRTARVVNLRN